MNKIGKCSILSLAALLLLLSCAFELASASVPSVPEFTVATVDHSYIVPAATDPYSGQIDPSYIIQNKTIDITIKNQPFTSSCKYIYLSYAIREKGYYETGWRNISSFSRNSSPGRLASDSANTVVSIPLYNYPDGGGQVDFQVQAAIVTAHPIWEGSNMGYWTFETSDWSSTKTVTIPASSSGSPIPSSASSNPTSASTQTTATPEFNIVEIAILAVLIILTVLVALLIVTLRRRR